MSTGERPHLELRDVCFAYPDGRPILDGVSATVPRGASWSIVGPNGSGKSTLLRVMAGLLRPSRGQVLLDGQPLSLLRSRQRARRIAFLPQSVAPVFGYVARQVVAMGRYPHLSGIGLESRHDWQLVDEAMAWTETSELAYRELSALSGGERQRVLIAAALVQASDLLLLDEPTTALDVNHQIGIHRLLARLSADRGWTVVTVTHDLNLAAYFSRHVLMLQRGRVAAEGTPEEVLTTEKVARVYGIAMHGLTHPTTGAPVLVPIDLASEERAGRHDEGP
ncbi:MAG: ABC transporter ATP-binding protein [Phycisphaerae bacterium]|nr:ABC transporter ATP-binding protein [Phycisphaerae bacterium]